VENDGLEYLKLLAYRHCYYYYKQTSVCAPNILLGKIENLFEENASSAQAYADQEQTHSLSTQPRRYRKYMYQGIAHHPSNNQREQS